MTAVVVGVGGVTCGGKTTISKELQKRFPGTVIFHMDDYFLPDDSPAHTLLTEYTPSCINWDIVTAVDFIKLVSDLETLLGTRRVVIHDTGGKLEDKRKLTDGMNDFDCKLGNDLTPVCGYSGGAEGTNDSVLLVLVDGILIYEYEPLQRYFSRKYFVTLTFEEAKQRRVVRDFDIDEENYFERCAWPSYLKCLDRIVPKKERILSYQTPQLGFAEHQSEGLDSLDFLLINGSDSLDYVCEWIEADIRALCTGSSFESLDQSTKRIIPT